MNPMNWEKRRSLLIPAISRSVEAPGDYHIIFYFGEKEAVLIETDSIVEAFPQ